MNRFVILASILVALASSAAAPAQKKLEDDEYVAEKPTIGDKFPELVVFSPEGKEVRPSDWKGHYTVLTFGCLT